MTLNNAALLALIGTIVMTVLLVWNFVSNVVYVLRGVQAPVVLFASFIYHLCVRLLNRDGVLFRLPSGAAVGVIWAGRALDA
jgi:hypothetical protein